MAWTVHKPADCNLGKQRKEDQKKTKANSAVVASSATTPSTTLSNRYAALLATIATLNDEE